MKGGALAAAAVAVAGGLWPGGATARPTGPADPFYGVVVQEDSLRPVDVRRLRNGAVGTVRFVISWPKVERHDGEWDFGAVDAELRAIRAAGAEPLPFLYGTPRWLGEGAPPIGTAHARSEWAHFVRRVVGRYGPGGQLASSDPEFVPIERWQVWNEPNLPAFWGGRDPSADEYVELLRVSAQAIHTVDPAASVIAAGLPPAPKRVPAPEFISQLYARYAELGRAPDFDEIAVHPYGSGAAASVANFDAFVAAVRAALAPGAPLPPILVGEIGWGSRGRPHQFLTGTRRTQEHRLNRAYKMYAARREVDNISSVLWFAWRDVPEGTGCEFCPDVGLFNVRDRAKPAWKRFRTMPRG